MYYSNVTVLLNTTGNHSISDSSFGTLRRAATGWTPLLIVKLIISILSLFFNTAVLLVHCFIPAYIDPFSVYLLALFLSNLFYILLSRPIAVLDELYGIYPAAGYPVCFLFMYNKVSSVIPVLLHVLISLNRVWAVTFPISYRERHTKRLAVFICIGVVVYVHLLNLPPFLVDQLLHYPAIYAKYQDCGHISPNFLDFNKADDIINRLLPMLIVMVAYAFIIVKLWLKRHSRRRSIPISLKKLPARKKSSKQNPQPTAAQPSPPKKTVKPFVVLTLTTISVVVCWAPIQVFFFMGLFLHIGLPTIVLTIVTTLYSLQMIFDPLVWIGSLRSDN
ncbi:5-hydroxytryptamine receptor 1B-like [Paramacrobiotus metropolitanus]|uniref:5-hydroxytryptamine receptor 1B-like n=1 Tax=Paramacrobiotus metropolitanus TaxID=2943436 RepID=UPI002445B720|nr:5-hydroxytryptamine receptor 1B-like [Paramacrobiotus metropolitanus]